MSDAADDATAREELERELQIAAARLSTAEIHPVLDCPDCSGLTQDAAKLQCEFFKDCVSDWTRITRMTKIKGKSDGLV